jgi:hypothetical protein
MEEHEEEEIKVVDNKPSYDNAMQIEPLGEELLISNEELNLSSFIMDESNKEKFR